MFLALLVGAAHAQTSCTVQPGGSATATYRTRCILSRRSASEQVLDEVTFSRDGPVPCFVSREIEG